MVITQHQQHDHVSLTHTHTHTHTHPKLDTLVPDLRSTVLTHIHTHLCHFLHPSVNSITCHLQVGVIELVLLGPAQRSIPQPLLNDGVEPGQQEVQPSPLSGLLLEEHPPVKLGRKHITQPHAPCTSGQQGQFQRS